MPPVRFLESHVCRTGGSSAQSADGNLLRPMPNTAVQINVKIPFKPEVPSRANVVALRRERMFCTVQPR